MAAVAAAASFSAVSACAAWKPVQYLCLIYELLAMNPVCALRVSLSLSLLPLPVGQMKHY